MQFLQPTTKFYVSKFVNLDILQFEQIQGEVVPQRRDKKETKQKLRHSFFSTNEAGKHKTEMRLDGGNIHTA